MFTVINKKFINALCITSAILLTSGFMFKGYASEATGANIVGNIVNAVTAANQKQPEVAPPATPAADQTALPKLEDILKAETTAPASTQTTAGTVPVQGSVAATAALPDANKAITQAETTPIETTAVQSSAPSAVTTETGLSAAPVSTSAPTLVASPQNVGSAPGTQTPVAASATPLQSSAPIAPQKYFVTAQGTVFTPPEGMSFPSEMNEGWYYVTNDVNAIKAKIESAPQTPPMVGGGEDLNSPKPQANQQNIPTNQGYDQGGAQQPQGQPGNQGQQQNASGQQGNQSQQQIPGNASGQQGNQNQQQTPGNISGQQGNQNQQQIPGNFGGQQVGYPNWQPGNQPQYKPGVLPENQHQGSVIPGNIGQQNNNFIPNVGPTGNVINGQNVGPVSPSTQTSEGISNSKKPIMFQCYLA